MTKIYVKDIKRIDNLLNLLAYLIIASYCIAFGLYQPCFAFLDKFKKGKKSGNNIVAVSKVKSIKEFNFELFAANHVSKFALVGTGCSITFFVLGLFSDSGVATGIGSWIINIMFVADWILKKIRNKKIDEATIGN